MKFKSTFELKIDEIISIAKDDGESLLYELDKLVPSDPIKSGVDLYKGYIIDQYNCPKCNGPIGDEMYYFTYCPRCGKRLKK